MKKRSEVVVCGYVSTDLLINQSRRHVAYKTSQTVRRCTAIFVEITKNTEPIHIKRTKLTLELPTGHFD